MVQLTTVNRSKTTMVSLLVRNGYTEAMLNNLPPNVLEIMCQTCERATLAEAEALAAKASTGKRAANISWKYASAGKPNVSVYGLGRFPLTFYPGGLARLVGYDPNAAQADRDAYAATVPGPIGDLLRDVIREVSRGTAGLSWTKQESK